MNVFLIAALAVIVAACDLAPQASSSNAPSQKETEAIVRDYLLNNPDIVVEIVNNAAQYQKQREEASKTSALQNERNALLKVETGSFARGQGDITLVEFFDYQCGYCKKAFGDMLKAVDRDKSVRIVLKEFPILGEMSRFAARAAMASKRQGLYMKFHTALMTTPGRLSEAKIFQIAGDIGLDVKRLRRDMASEKITAAIAKNHDLAQRLSISGTPAFIMVSKAKTEFIAGARDEEQFVALFKQARDQ